MRKDRHHLLEIILWPNNDGTFTKIVNSAQRLKELDIYNDFKLCIEIEHGEHTALHNRNLSEERRNKFKLIAINNNPAKNPETAAKISKSLTVKKLDDAVKKKISIATKGDRNPMYRKNAWAIACSRKTPEQIEATRKSKSEKMKKYWKEKRQKKEVMPV